MNDTYREKTQFIIAMVDIEIFKAQLIVEYMRATSKEIPCFLIFFAFLFSSHTVTVQFCDKQRLGRLRGTTSQSA